MKTVANVNVLVELGGAPHSPLRPLHQSVFYHSTRDRTFIATNLAVLGLCRPMRIGDLSLPSMPYSSSFRVFMVDVRSVNSVMLWFQPALRFHRSGLVFDPERWVFGMMILSGCG